MKTAISKSLNIETSFLITFFFFFSRSIHFVLLARVFNIHTKQYMFKEFHFNKAASTIRALFLKGVWSKPKRACGQSVCNVFGIDCEKALFRLHLSCLTWSGSTQSEILLRIPIGYSLISHYCAQPKNSCSGDIRRGHFSCRI